MSAHTPGPWVVEKKENKEFDRYTGKPSNEISYAVMAENPRACIMAVCSPYLADAEANTRLIAAAPEMLSELFQLLEEFKDKECNCDGEYTYGGLVGHACYFHRIEAGVKRAIAKATGGKP